MNALIANLGIMLQLAGLFTAAPATAGLFFGEFSEGFSLALTSFVFLGVGFVLRSSSESREMNYANACAFVALSFLALSIIGSIPYIYPKSGGSILAPFDGFFESVSGYTTTGHTMVGDPSKLPESIKLYRSLTQFLGGLTVVLIFVSFFSPRHGYDIKKAMGLEETKHVFKKTLKKILAVYLALSAVATVLLYALLSEHTVVDAVSLVASGVSTGGFTTRTLPQENMPLTVLALTMFLGSVNFFAYYATGGEKYRKVVKGELSVFLGLVFATAAALMLFGAGLSGSLFHAASAATTTGFSHEALQGLGIISKMSLVFLMFVGGASFSTAGGLKVSRAVTLAKAVPIYAYNRLRGRQKRVMLWGRPVRKERLKEMSQVALGIVFLASFSTFAFAFSGYAIVDSFFESVSSVSTTGLSVGLVGPDLPGHLKALLCVLMLAGRVEVTAFFVLLKKMAG